MRPRVRSDWAMDLAGRRDLETRFGEALRGHPSVRGVRDNTAAFDELDYTIDLAGIGLASVELKAKWQHYSQGWTRHRPDLAEADLFILDELALRKIIATGRHGYVAIYDHPSTRWRIYGVADLVLASKTRIARPLHGNRPTTKGKILLDLRDGHDAGHTSQEAVLVLAGVIATTERQWSRVEPWPTPTRKQAG